MILVRDVMAKNVKTIKVDDSVFDAVVKMNKFDIGSVIVMNGSRPVGIITGKNVLTKVVEPRIDPTLIRAKDAMSSPLVTVNADSTIEEAAVTMSRKHIKKLAVVEKDKLVGVISTSDIVKANPAQISILQELLKIS